MTENPTQESKPYDPNEATANLPPSEPVVITEPSHTPDSTERRRGDNWIWGIALILLGGLFLLQNMTSFRLVNWWAVFILIPAAGSFASAWRKYKEAGRLNGGARSALFGGLIFTAVAAIFLLNLDLGQFWPVFIIAAGLAIMVNALLPD